MAPPIIARPKQTVTREIAITLHDKDPQAPVTAPETAPATTPTPTTRPTTTPTAAAESFMQRAIACLLLLIFLALVVLIGLVCYFVVEIKPLVSIARDLHPHVEPAVGALTQLSRVSEELQPAVTALTSLTAGVNVSSFIRGVSLTNMLKDGLAELPETVSLTFSQIVRDFGPPQSIPNLITHALSTHYGNLTSALVRIGRKLEPKLAHFNHYDYGLLQFVSHMSQLFQAVEYLDGPIHEAEAEVFGVVQPPLNSDGDLAATLTHWLGRAPVEYVVSQLDQDAWNLTTAACHSLREELSIIMTKMSIVHPHIDMHRPIWVSGSYDEHGVWQNGFYTMMRPRPPSPPPPAPPAPPPSPKRPSICSSWCISEINRYPPGDQRALESQCRSNTYQTPYCSACDHCVAFLEAHPDPLRSPPPPPRYSSMDRYSYDDSSGPWDERSETPLEQGLREFYTNLAPVCLIFSTLA